MKTTEERSETTEEKTARYSSAMMMAGLLMNTATQYEDDFRDMLRDLDWTHSVGAILDPTMYRDFLYDENKQKNVQILGCIGRFITDLRKQKVIE